MDIEFNINKYIYGDGKSKGINPYERYASFDYCFNYFQVFRDSKYISEIASKKYIQQSCLQLGFYLASWGMLRGSAALLTKSMKIYEPIMDFIAQSDITLWEIDAGSYTNENIEILLKYEKQLEAVLEIDNKPPSSILTTKIMLGVFGNVPAFDTYFKKGLGVSTFGKKSLLKIEKFYNDNCELIDKHRVFTLDFDTGMNSQRNYTRAKVIDMVFFIEGGIAQQDISADAQDRAADD